MKQLISLKHVRTAMDSRTVAEILRIASTIDKDGFGAVVEDLADAEVLGKMFHGATSRDSSICDLAASRLGLSSVDLSWTNVDMIESALLLEELSMASKVVDLLVTAFSSHETFGDGRKLTTKFPESSTVPVISLHDDFYDWQSALSHLHGFQRELGDLKGKQVVIAWGFGSSFISPAVAHGLLVTSALLCAKVRVAAPPEFSLLNRVRKEAKEIATEAGSTLEETTDFTDAFRDADAVFSLNWLRLDDFNHPERNTLYARKYKDWYVTQDILSRQCIFSTEPPLQPELTFSPDLLEDQRNISSSWLIRRVHVLAATIVYVLRESRKGGIASVV